MDDGSLGARSSRAKPVSAEAAKGMCARVRVHVCAPVCACVCRPCCPALGAVWLGSVLPLPRASVRWPGNSLGRAHVPTPGWGCLLPAPRQPLHKTHVFGGLGWADTRPARSAPGRRPWGSHEDWRGPTLVGQMGTLRPPGTTGHHPHHTSVLQSVRTWPWS